MKIMKTVRKKLNFIEVRKLVYVVILICFTSSCSGAYIEIEDVNDSVFDKILIKYPLINIKNILRNLEILLHEKFRGENSLLSIHRYMDKYESTCNASKELLDCIYRKKFFTKETNFSLSRNLGTIWLTYQATRDRDHGRQASAR